MTSLATSGAWMHAMDAWERCQALLRAQSSLSLALALATLYLLWWYLQSVQRQRSCPKNAKLAESAWRLPIIGSPAVYRNMWRPLESLVEQHMLHPTLSFATFEADYVSTADPVNVQWILNDNFENYVKGPEFHEKFKELLGEGIFNVDGALWRMHRKTASRVFSREMLREHMLPVFLEHCELMSKRLRAAAASGEVVDFQDLFRRFTLDSICEIAFGVRVGGLEGKDVPFSRAFDEAQLVVNRRFTMPDWRLLRFLRVGPERRLRRAVRIIDDFAMRIINARRREQVDAGGAAVEQREVYLDRVDLLTHFASLKDDKGAPLMTATELRDVVMNFMIAGRDTTAQALTWTTLCLLQHPDALRQVLTEVDAAAATGAMHTYDGILGMKGLHGAIMESIRLYPPVPKDLKYVVKDDVLPDGTFVPKGMQIMYCPFAMGRMPRLWDNPLQFDPSRFERMQGQPSPYLFTAFQAGPRICLGQTMAHLESACVLAHLLREFELELIPGQSFYYQDSVTGNMQGGLRARVRVRGAASPAPQPAAAERV